MPHNDQTRHATDLRDMAAADIMQRLDNMGLATLIEAAGRRTLGAHGALVTYSRKIFIPLTQLCRDMCHYCTFAVPPSRVKSPFLSREQVVAIAQAGAKAGCREALFTLGDRPEARYPAAREALAALGHADTLSYLRDMAALVREETGLLPHINAGILTAPDFAALRPVAASMGLMLESTSDRLCAKGMPHYGSPDKIPAVRLACIEEAGRAKVPFTTGILIGIGETRLERIEALLAIRDAHARHGHMQEVIIQNFRAKPGTRMAHHPEPSLDEHLWTIAAARLILDPHMTIQAPPNLQSLTDAPALLRAGVNDWGGVSPVTLDHVNPEAPWPHIGKLEEVTAETGRHLRERLAIGPRHASAPATWIDQRLRAPILRQIDARGLPIAESWRPGMADAMPRQTACGGGADGRRIVEIIEGMRSGIRPEPSDIVRLFEAEGDEVIRIATAADALRREVAGEPVSFVVNRNINYTNMCTYRCGFCAFSKGTAKALRGPAYRLDFDEIGRRAAEAAEHGCSEVCLQGGIHPDYDGDTYLRIVETVRAAAPDMHVHAFSPLEVTHGASTLGLSVEAYLARLRDAGLSSLPGTAAEILTDRVRAIICPDKIRTSEWLNVMRAAHEAGLRSTATIMFGHVDSYADWAEHLLAIRDLQAQTGGFTEFVPLPFVHMEAPIWLKGKARSGPSAREVLLMHAIARLALHPLIGNIQTSWVKLGEDGAVAALQAGANDLGGTLMDESITRAAGGAQGQSRDADWMRAVAGKAGRSARQRTTFYGERTTARLLEELSA